MTEKEKQRRIDSFPTLPILFEGRLRGGLIYFTVSGVRSIADLTATGSEIITDKARIFVSGERISLEVFEGGIVTVGGRITGVEFKYGKT